MDNDVRDGQPGRTRELTAPASGRLDTVLAQALPEFSRSRLQRMIEDGLVFVGGEAARKSVAVREGDAITLEVPAAAPATPPDIADLPILFEDDWLTAVDKPAGLAVHGAPGDVAPCVATWWAARLGEAAASFASERPGIVHRLDKDTSGVLLLARTPEAQAALSRAFEAREVRKTYVALVEGVPARPRAVIDAPIDRDPRDRTRMAVTTRGRASRTAYEAIADDGRRSLFQVHPETGRTHQIRVHLAAVGLPIVDDAVYGRPSPAGRQMLHAYRIEFRHPAGGRLTVTAPTPLDVTAAIRSVAGEALASAYEASCAPEYIEPAAGPHADAPLPAAQEINH